LILTKECTRTNRIQPTNLSVLRAESLWDRLLDEAQARAADFERQSPLAASRGGHQCDSMKIIKSSAVVLFKLIFMLEANPCMESITPGKPLYLQYFHLIFFFSPRPPFARETQLKTILRRTPPHCGLMKAPSPGGRGGWLSSGSPTSL